MREGVAGDESPLQSLPQPLPLATEPGTPLVTMTTPHQQPQMDVLKLSHKTVHFPGTVLHTSKAEIWVLVEFTIINLLL